MFQGFNNYYMSNIDRGGREVLGVNSLKSYIATGNSNPYNSRLRSSKGDSFTSRQVKKVVKNTLSIAGAFATIAATSLGAVALIKGCSKGGNIRKLFSKILNSSKAASNVASNASKSKVASKIKAPKILTSAKNTFSKLFKKSP